jgi:flagellar FliJ protein
MTRTEKLEPVVKHVDQHEQEALQAVAFSQQQLDKQLELLQQLQKYRLEYTARQSSGEVAYSAVQFQEINRFIAQLDDSIRQQQQIVDLAQRELELKQQAWHKQRSRSQAIHKVVDRLKQGEQQKAQITEQKIMDELALRLHLKGN